MIYVIMTKILEEFYMKNTWITPELKVIEISSTTGTVVPSNCTDGIYMNDELMTEIVCS